MTNSTDIPQEVRDLAAGIADDIEQNGHYQGGFNPAKRGACCLVVNSHVTSGWAAGDLWGLLCESGIRDLISWNDTAPTAEVVATLRKVAAGERP